jgi:ABC-type lipoprotein export system ATPase subunit
MIEIENLSKSFSSVSVLKNISFSCPDKGLVLIEGENGSGKTTLFDILSLLDGSFDGKYTYFGKDVRTMKDAEKARIRKDEISYVFQKRNLVRYLSKEENLSLRQPCRRRKAGRVFGQRLADHVPRPAGKAGLGRGPETGKESLPSG